MKSEKIRSINLKLINNTSLTKEEKIFIKGCNFIINKTKKLKLYYAEDFKEYAMFGKNKKDIIFQYKENGNMFWVSRKKIYNKLIKYGMGMADVIIIIKYYVSNELK